MTNFFRENDPSSDAAAGVYAVMAIYGAAFFVAAASTIALGTASVKVAGKVWETAKDVFATEEQRMARFDEDIKKTTDKWQQTKTLTEEQRKQLDTEHKRFMEFQRSFRKNVRAPKLTETRTITFSTKQKLPTSSPLNTVPKATLTMVL